MTIRVGDIVQFPFFNSQYMGLDGVYYLILTTNKRSYYDILCLNDGHSGTLYKKHVIERAMKIV